MKIKRDELIQALRFAEKTFSDVELRVEFCSTSDSFVITGFDDSNRKVKVQVFNATRHLFPTVTSEKRLGDA